MNSGRGIGIENCFSAGSERDLSSNKNHVVNGEILVEVGEWIWSVDEFLSFCVFVNNCIDDNSGFWYFGAQRWTYRWVMPKATLFVGAGCCQEKFASL